MQYVLMGKIVNTQGIRGEMRVYPETDDISRFELLRFIVLRKTVLGKTSEQRYKLLSVKPHKKILIIRLLGIDDMNAAEKLVGSEIVTDRADLPPLLDGEFFIHDLIGMNVVTSGGEPMGTLTNVLVTGANDVYVISMENRKDILLPAIKKCVKSIDLESKTIIVELLPGLADI